VRRTADKALDVLVDADEEWAVKIRRMKFESYNQDWLAVVEVRGEATGVTLWVTRVFYLPGGGVGGVGGLGWRRPMRRASFGRPYVMARAAGGALHSMGAQAGRSAVRAESTMDPRACVRA
jgi:hypothetical protein